MAEKSTSDGGESPVAEKSTSEGGESPVAAASAGEKEPTLKQVTAELRAVFPAADLELQTLGSGRLIVARIGDEAQGMRGAIGRELAKRFASRKLPVPPLVYSESEWRALEPEGDERRPDHWVRLVELHRQRSPQPRALRQQLLGQLREDRALIESLSRNDPFHPRWSLWLAAAALQEVLGLLLATLGLPLADDVEDEEDRAKFAEEFGETEKLIEVHRGLRAAAAGYRQRSELLATGQIEEAGWNPLLQQASEGIARAERQIIARLTTAEERRRRRRLIWTVVPASAIALVLLVVVSWVATRPIPPLSQPVKGPGGVTVEYFSDRAMSKRLLKRGEHGIFLQNLQGRSPLAEAGTRYGMRWTGFWRIGRPGVHSLCLRSQGRARLSFAGKLLIDDWEDPGASPKPSCEKVRLVPGWYGLQVDYYHEAGPALLELKAGIEGYPLVRLVGGRICCKQPVAGKEQK